MIIQKIKDWLLNPKKHFKVLTVYGNTILVVNRLKDDAIFGLGPVPLETSESGLKLSIESFDDNCINAHVSLTSIHSVGKSIYKIELNDIEMNQDAKVKTLLLKGENKIK